MVLFIKLYSRLNKFNDNLYTQHEKNVISKLTLKCLSICIHMLKHLFFLTVAYK